MITQEDLQTLPFILLGLNYLKYFPEELHPKAFGKLLAYKCPHMKFYTSKITGKIIAAGAMTKDCDSIFTLVFNFHVGTGSPLVVDF